MFIRKKLNHSGIISIQVIDKSDGNYRVIKTIGSSSDKETIDSLYQEGKKWIENQLGINDIFEDSKKEHEEQHIVEYLLSNIENILLNGPQLILDRVFNKIGFDQIEDTILKQLVIARLSQPMSKSGTVEYLKSYYDQDVKLHKIYRYLDKLYNTQQERIQQISITHTQKILGGKIGLLFYDVTTLYFETDHSDELRETGFSKDGKHSQPQIVLGLLVSKEGYPLSYSIFNGSQYEGRTMIPIIEDFIGRFELEDFVIVADSGLMNKKNLMLLESFGHQYIIGAKVKSETEEVKNWILSLSKHENVFNEYQKNTTTRLIVGYSEKRAKKDKYNREKGVRRLQSDYKNGRVTKENINKRGYNKYLEITKDVKVTINQQKIIEDQKWDGLKGYITNTKLSAKEVHEHYNGLWIIENAFRITKGTIEIRPIFHFSPKRIEAHITICFVAYKVYKELERIIKISEINLSVDKVLTIAKTITTLKINLPKSKTTLNKTMILTQKQQSIAKLFDENFWKNF
jgi:transposase